MKTWAMVGLGALGLSVLGGGNLMHGASQVASTADQAIGTGGDSNGDGIVSGRERLIIDGAGGYLAATGGRDYLAARSKERAEARRAARSQPATAPDDEGKKGKPKGGATVPSEDYATARARSLSGGDSSETAVAARQAAEAEAARNAWRDEQVARRTAEQHAAANAPGSTDRGWRFGRPSVRTLADNLNRTAPLIPKDSGGAPVVAPGPGGVPMPVPG